MTVTHDKATQDVDSPYDGIVKDILFKEGDIVKCKVGASGQGDIVVMIDDGIGEASETVKQESIESDTNKNIPIENK